MLRLFTAFADGKVKIEFFYLPGIFLNENFFEMKLLNEK